jgi:hypothetical protein
VKASRGRRSRRAGAPDDWGGDMGNGGDVVTGRASQAGIQVNRGLVVSGAALIGFGGLLGATGMLLLSSAVLAAARRWVRQLERPPQETAKLRWQQAKAATAAGAEVWRSKSPTRS